MMSKMSFKGPSKFPIGMIIKLPPWVLFFFTKGIYLDPIILETDEEIEKVFGKKIKPFRRGSVAKLVPPLIIKPRRDCYIKIQFRYNIFNSEGRTLWPSS